jgi:hypothetical protein
VSLVQTYNPVTSVNDQTGDITIDAQSLGVGAYRELAPVNLPVSNATRIALARKASLVYSLTELRNSDLVGNTTVFTTEIDREGYWYYDPTDLESEDNTGTVVVSFSGKRYKRYNFGTILSSWFEQTNEGFQKFLDASQNKTGIINKSINLTASINFRSGTIEQYNGVVVSTSASKGFVGENVNLQLTNVVLRATNANVDTLLELVTSKVIFFNVELKDWYVFGLKSYSCSLFSQILRITGINVPNKTVGTGFYARQLNDSFLNDLYVTQFGNQAIYVEAGFNNYFLNTSVSSGLYYGPVVIKEGALNSFTNLSVAGNTLNAFSLEIINTSDLRFINCRFGSSPNLEQQLYEPVYFQNCQFGKLYTGAYPHRMVCTDCTFAGLPSQRKGSVTLTSTSGQTQYRFPHGLANTPRYLSLNPGYNNPVRGFSLTSDGSDVVCILDQPIASTGTNLLFYFQLSI